MTYKETAVTGTLLLSVAALACAMAVTGRATWLEAVSFVTGAWCVWLTVKQNIWNFPIGLLNVATFCVVFFQARLFADAALQIVYFGLGLMGWYLWLRGSGKDAPLRVSRAGQAELALLLGCSALSTLGLWQLLQQAGGSATFWDALTTSLSLASQWLLNRKKLESWAGWIVVDIIYVPLYLYKGLFLTAILYTLFLVMAIMGLAVWRKSWRAMQEGPRLQVDLV